MTKILIYSQPDCAPCDWVKNYLIEQNLDFEVKDVINDAEAYTEFIRMGYKSTPVVFINGKPWTFGQAEPFPGSLKTALEDAGLLNQ